MEHYVIIYPPSRRGKPVHEIHVFDVSSGKTAKAPIAIFPFFAGAGTYAEADARAEMFVRALNLAGGDRNENR